MTVWRAASLQQFKIGDVKSVNSFNFVTFYNYSTNTGVEMNIITMIIILTCLWWCLTPLFWTAFCLLGAHIPPLLKYHCQWDTLQLESGTCMIQHWLFHSLFSYSKHSDAMAWRSSSGWPSVLSCLRGRQVLWQTWSKSNWEDPRCDV